MRSVGAAFSPKHLPRRGFVFLVGEPATGLSRLAAGRLKVIREVADGQEVIARQIRPGEVFGDAGVWEETTDPASALARTDAVGLQFPVTAFRALNGAHPAPGLAIIKILASRPRDAEERIEQLQTERVERRIAQVSLRLARKSGIKTAEGIPIGVPLSRQNLAAMAGTTLSTASRTARAERRARIVAVGRQEVMIGSPPRLVALAGNLASTNEAPSPP